MTNPNVPDNHDEGPYWSDYSPEYKEFDEIPHPLKPELKWALVAAGIFVLLIAVLAIIEAFS